MNQCSARPDDKNPSPITIGEILAGKPRYGHVSETPFGALNDCLNETDGFAAFEEGELSMVDAAEFLERARQLVGCDVFWDERSRNFLDRNFGLIEEMIREAKSFRARLAPPSPYF